MDVVCYVQRKRVTDWKRLSLTHKHPAFIYGSNDDRVFGRKLGKGDTLWVVSSLPKGFPPQLVARIQISKIGKRNSRALGVAPDLLRHFREFRWIAVGSKRTNEFFGYNNAGKALLELVFEGPSTLWKLSPSGKSWKSKYGSKLQRPAVIAPKGMSTGKIRSPGAEPLQKIEKLASKTVFISWKWKDNSPGRVLKIAKALTEAGFMPWLDLLALPTAKALSLIQKDAPKLERLLRYGYRRTAVVLALGTGHYGEQSETSEKNWTKREWTGALAPQKELYKVVYPVSSHRLPDFLSSADHTLKNKTPRSAAMELKKWFNRHVEPMSD